MAHTLYATKKNITQVWDQNGHRLPVTVLDVKPHVITQIKTQDKNDYSAIQVAIGTKKKSLSKATANHLAKAKLDKQPQHTKEIRFKSDQEVADYQLGQTLDPLTFFQVGDQIKAVGVSKGRGFAGVVKRWGFAGGPRTHGQSDRERAPGSIGQGTTPGRVYKGKKMAGRYGNQQFTIKNLVVVKIDADSNQIWIKGTVPGPISSMVQLIKTGTTKFPGLISQSNDQDKTQTSTDSNTETPDSKPSSDTKEKDAQDSPKESADTKKTDTQKSVEVTDTKQNQSE